MHVRMRMTGVQSRQHLPAVALVLQDAVADRLTGRHGIVDIDSHSNDEDD